MMGTSTAVSEVYPLLFSHDVGALADWAVAALDLTESWRAPGEDGTVEHAEVLWPGGRVSINIRAESNRGIGPGSIALRVDDRERVDALYQRAQAAGAEVSQAPLESRVAYSFTLLDPDGNQWWVNAETGFLDEIRSGS